MKTRIINLFGGPGTGKSTNASGLFYKMKISDISCELVTEYPKTSYGEDNSTPYGIINGSYSVNNSRESGS